LQGIPRLRLEEDGSMPKTAKDSASGNDESEEKDEEKIEYDEDYSPKRGVTFIFLSAGFSLILFAVLSGLRSYIISKISGVAYSYTQLYGYYHIFDLTYTIATTCVTALAAAVLYFSWSGEKKPFSDSLMIGLSVSIFSLFILFLLHEVIWIGYIIDWVGILVLLVLGTLSGPLGLKLSK
jgi:hypothetical protein